MTVSFRFKYNQTQEEASARRGRSGAWSLPVTATGYVCVCEHVCMCAALCAALCACVCHCVHVLLYVCTRVHVCIVLCVACVFECVCAALCVCRVCVPMFHSVLHTWAWRLPPLLRLQTQSAIMEEISQQQSLPAWHPRGWGAVLTAATWGLQPLTRPRPLSAPSPWGSLFHAPFHSEG